jgi:Ala-tRNA(Pro) deacylase
MNIPTRLLDFLNESKVKYQVVHHPVAFTAQELAAIEHVKGKQHAKVVMVRAGAKPVMAVLPADHRVDLELLGKVAGGVCVLAGEDEFKGIFPDCQTGTMPPFGRLYGVDVYMDESLKDDGAIVFEAGTHTDAVRISYIDYERLAKPVVAKFAVKSR